MFHTSLKMKCSIASILALVVCKATAFTPSPFAHKTISHAPTFTLSAGGFEWEDPAEAFDQGVENPFKNPDLMKGDGDMKIDPARLLGPRLQGTNLYFVGMMGSGKSAVGDIVAKREFQVKCCCVIFSYCEKASDEECFVTIVIMDRIRFYLDILRWTPIRDLFHCETRITF